MKASAGAIQSEATFHSALRPTVRAARSATASAANARDPGLDVAERTVGESGLGSTDAGCGVGQIVGEYLGRIGPTSGGQGLDAGGDDRLGDGDRAGCGGEVGEKWVFAVHQHSVPARTWHPSCEPTLVVGSTRRHLCDDGDEWWEHDRVVSRVHLRDQLEVVGHRSRAG